MHKHQPLISIYCWRRPIPAHPAAEHELFKETLAISSLTWFDPTKDRTGPKQEYDPKVPYQVRRLSRLYQLSRWHAFPSRLSMRGSSIAGVALDTVSMTARALAAFNISHPSGGTFSRCLHHTIARGMIDDHAPVAITLASQHGNAWRQPGRHRH
jgi:hypothetical protein